MLAYLFLFFYFIINFISYFFQGASLADDSVSDVEERKDFPEVEVSLWLFFQIMFAVMHQIIHDYVQNYNIRDDKQI